MNKIRIRHFYKTVWKINCNGEVVGVKGPGGLTLATIQDGDRIFYGVAKCMKGDVFRKRYGVSYASDRALLALENNVTVGEPNINTLHGSIDIEDVKSLLEYARRNV